MTTSTYVLWIGTIVLSLHFARSYILLTANLEDVHAIAKQIVESPVAGQLNKILRRATNLFNQQVARSRFQKRADDDMDSEGADSHLDHQSDVSIEDQGHNKDGHEERRRGVQQLVNLGKNASYYLKTIKKMFENV